MKNSFMRSDIKAAIDNLPSGICFFDENGLPVLCNIVMHRLVFALTGRDLQLQSDLSSALERLPDNSTVTRDSEAFLLPDGTAWQFQERAIRDSSGKAYTEYIAADVTELYARQRELKQSSAAQKRLAMYMRRITKNIVAITREEELLTMKMQVHGEVGWGLQALRQFYNNGCPAEQKDEIVAGLKKVVGTLRGEIGHTDETGGFDELLQIAADIGVNIIIEGERPKNEDAEAILVAAIRECLTNMIYHAGGDRLAAVFSSTDSAAHIRITNNGTPPQKEIVEGGGLLSLRRRAEKAGGIMTVQSLPRFELCVTVPLGEENYLP